MSAAIDINLDQEVFPENFTAQLAQSSPRRGGPERGELFWAELDLAFFPVYAASHFESQRRGFSFFAETNLPAGGLCRQVALRDDIAPRTVQFLRQLLKQKLALNFPAVWNSRLHWCDVQDAKGDISRGRDFRVDE